MVRLTTLGTVRIGCDQGVELAFAAHQPKRIALLAYLAIARPRGAHRRDSLLALLWPDLDAERGRAALRQALHGIRKSLGAQIVVSPGTDMLEVNRSALDCDIWAFERAAAAGDHAGAIQGHQGDLLAGLFVPDAPEFERWLDAERARVRTLVIASAFGAAERSLEQRRTADALQYARCALALADLDEGVVRRAMQVMARAGERAAALSAYEQISGALRRELDTEPDAATQTLAAQLRSDNVPPEIAPVPRLAMLRPTPQRRWVVAAVASLVAIAAAARIAPSVSPAPDPRHVHVAAFENASGGPALDTLARATGMATVDALGRLENIVLLARAVDSARAGTVVRGLVRSLPDVDSIEWRAQIVDRESGRMLRTVVSRAPAGSSSAPPEFLERLSAGLATALYPGWGTALSQPPSYAGYRLFVEGLRHIKLEQHDAAIVVFRRAFDEDSTFTAAGLVAGMEYYHIGRHASADSLVRRIGPRRALLPPVDAHLLDWLTQSLRGDRVAARLSMQAVVALAPTADLARLQLAVDHVETAQPREALQALDAIPVESEFAHGWAAYWATRAEALHLLGDHRRELAVARTGLRRHPELRVLANYELRALAALGRVDELRTRIANGALSPRAHEAQATLRQVALELSAHGRPDEGQVLLARVGSWYDSRPASERASLAFQGGLARTRSLRGDWPGARAIYDSLLQVYPGCLDCLGAVGMLAAREGSRAMAEAHLTRLGAAERPFMLGRNVLWQARIAAALGDRERAASLLTTAFAAGAEYDVLAHTDPVLSIVRPDSVYRAFARSGN